MTIKEVFIRFSLTYIVLIIALYIFNVFLQYLGVPPIHSIINVMLLMASTMFACDTFAKKNKRYFTSEEKKKVVIGFIIISFIFDGMGLAFNDLAPKAGANILLIAIGVALIIDSLIIYIFVGLTGLRKRYIIKKDEAALNNNEHDDKVIQNENKYPKEAMRTLWAFWILSVLSLLVLLYVGYAEGKPSNSLFSSESTRVVLSILLLITLLCAYLLRKRMLIMRGIGTSAPISTPASLPYQNHYVRKYSLAVLLSLFFSCIMSIYGIILLYSGSDYLTYCIFLSISFISLCYFRPKKAEFNNMVSTLQQEGNQEMTVE